MCVCVCVCLCDLKLKVIQNIWDYHQHIRLFLLPLVNECEVVPGRCVCEQRNRAYIRSGIIISVFLLNWVNVYLDCALGSV